MTRSSKDSKRITALETKLAELECTLQVQASELDLLNEAASANPVAAYIQNIATATVHQASPKYFGRARCGWTYDGPTARARRTVPANSYRTLPHLNGLPGDIICDRCLPTERAAALGRDLVHDEVSGDEQPVDVQDD